MFYGDAASTMSWIPAVNLLFLLFGVLIAWYALKGVRWEVFLRDAKGRSAAVLRILLAILLGYELTKFLNEYLMASTLLRQLL